MSSKKTKRAAAFLSRATLHKRPDGQPVYDVQYLLSPPTIHIETDPEKVVSCPFVRRNVLLALPAFKKFGTFHPSDYTTDGVLLSYKWEKKDNPDPSGRTLAFIKQYLVTNPNVPGCFVDYMCLPQQPRNVVQQRIFVKCLNAMNVWYTHYPVISCRLDERYFRSSWCICENLLASHAQNVAHVAGRHDADALMIHFLGNQLAQKLLITKKVLRKVKKQFGYRGVNGGEDMELPMLVQAVLANIMLRVIESRATNGSDRVFIVEIMRAFTHSTMTWVSQILPRRTMTDVRFENGTDIVGILEDGIEVRFKDTKVNPRDSLMGLTVMRNYKLSNDISYLFAV